MGGGTEFAILCLACLVAVLVIVVAYMGYALHEISLSERMAAADLGDPGSPVSEPFYSPACRRPERAPDGGDGSFPYGCSGGCGGGNRCGGNRCGGRACGGLTTGEMPAIESTCGYGNGQCCGWFGVPP